MRGRLASLDEGGVSVPRQLNATSFRASTTLLSLSFATLPIPLPIYLATSSFCRPNPTYPTDLETVLHNGAPLPSYRDIRSIHTTSSYLQLPSCPTKAPRDPHELQLIPTKSGLRSKTLHLLPRNQRPLAQVPPRHLALQRPPGRHLYVCSRSRVVSRYRYSRSRTNKCNAQNRPNR